MSKTQHEFLLQEGEWAGPEQVGLRGLIAKAIVRTFEEAYVEHGPKQASYDPDTCHRAADVVVATLVGQLLGVRVDVEHTGVLGEACVRIDTERAPR